MLVFDVSNLESYQSLEMWRDTFQQTTGDTKGEIPIILVGNKSDKPMAIDTEKVFTDWIEPFQKSRNSSELPNDSATSTFQKGKAKIYLEASAIKNLGIENIFYAVAYYAFEY
jgi:GTPase SAR1 family protein